MIEIKVGEFLKKHINQIIKLCNEDNIVFENLQDKEYCHNTFGLNTSFSLISEFSKLKTNGLNIRLEKKYYVQDYDIRGESFRVCSQFGGNHLINGMSASSYHGQQLLFFFKEKGILLDEFQGKEISFIVASPSSSISPEMELSVETREKLHLGRGGARTSPLNQILYGPPGTGKTYNTINRALEIIDGKVQEDRSKAKARFEDLSSSGQIEFVTFHQSYGYEEFVEGIKASTDKGAVSYTVEDGTFKQLSERSKGIRPTMTSLYAFNNKINIWKVSLGDTQNSDDDYIFDYCKENNKIILGFGEGENFSDCKNRKDIGLKLNNTSSNNYALTALNMLINKMQIDDIVLVSFGNKKLRAIAKITGEYQCLDDDGLGNYIQSRSVQWLLIPETPFLHDRVLKKQFSQMTIYNIKSNVNLEKLQLLLSNNIEADQQHKNHILIIDEINRGNISKIFGELITLIEPSKRIGASEEIRLRLPYSNEEFGVPSNLYILGTMNTADRSIALMDTALRRRFEFVEMMPDAELLDFEVGGVHLKSLLQTINTRVEYLYDRDHTIGHAYFMGLDKSSSLAELNVVMRNKIIPLLQEYFYDDWEKIKLVLGSGFVETTPIKSQNIFGKTLDDEYEEDKKVYKISKEFNISDYQSIYKD